MPAFRYKARDVSGALVTGQMEGAGRDAVAAQLDTMGWTPISIESKRAWRWPDLRGWVEGFEGVRPQDLIILTRQLATLVSAGVPMRRCFEAVIAQTNNPVLKRSIHAVQADVEHGSALSDAFAKHPKFFDRLYVGMVRAGEAGGILAEVLDRTAGLAEHEAETRARIKAATRYPKIVIVAILAAFGIIVIFVLPRFITMYASFKAQLPLPTRILIGIHRVIQQDWYLLLGGAALLFFGTRWYINTPVGRFQWDGIKIRLPVFGPIFLKSALSRFAMIFGTLTRNGLPVLQTLEIVSETVGNVVISRVVDKVRDGVRQGRGIVQSMQESRIFPPVVTQMVAIGEETGRMEEVLKKVSQYYDAEVDHALRTLSTSLEPILLTAIGGMVLFLALAIFLPWWSIINVMKAGGG